MYFNYIVNWIYRAMKMPVPLIVSENVYGLVTVFDIFLFSVYLGVFIILIKYLITDRLDFHIGKTDINYTSNSYMSKNLRSKKNNSVDSDS